MAGCLIQGIRIWRYNDYGVKRKDTCWGRCLINDLRNKTSMHFPRKIKIISKKSNSEKEKVAL